MKKFLLIIFGVGLLASCSRQLDINTDPNNPSLSQGTPKLIFPSVVASSVGRLGADYAILGGMWSQFWTQNTTSSQYKTIDAFNLTKTDYGGSWSELYSGALNDADFVISKAKETGDWNYYLMGTVMKAYTYQVLVDLYDQVPYSESFKGAANLQPKFDDGFTVYKGILSELDTALAKNFTLSTNSPGGTTDLVFPAADASWTIDPWVRFANTLKLKIYLRMVYAKPTEAEAGIKALYAAGGNFLTTNAWVNIFVNAPDKSNPLFEYNFRKLNTDANLKASITFLSWLQANSDTRLPFYFQPSTGPTIVYTGINQGDYLNPDPAFNIASKPNIQATDPYDLISLAESRFLQAEALERYFAGAGAAEMYNAAVSASFSRYNLSSGAFTGAGGKYAYPTGTFEQKLEAIITQKWASLPNAHSLEAFFEKNRTGYPKTSAVYSTAPTYTPGQFVYPKNGITSGLFAKRLIFPDVERSKNSNTPDQKALTDKVWWDVK